MNFYSDIMNATSTFMDSGGNILGLVILMGIAFGILAILFYVSSNIDKYKRFKKIFKIFYSCFSYCAYGMLTVAIIGVPVYLGYLGIIYAQDNPEGSLEFIKWTGIVIGGFIGFTIVGYCTKNRIWKRIFKYHKQEKKEKELLVKKNNLEVEKDGL